MAHSHTDPAHEASASTETVDRGEVWRSVATASVLLAAHVPLLVKLGQRMWSRDHYQFFPLVLLGGLILAYLRLQDGVTRTAAVPRYRWTLWGLSALVLTLAVVAHSPWIGGLSFLVSAWAFLYALGGRGLLGRLWPAWGFLWFAIPLPLGLDLQLVTAMQRLATLWASGTLDQLGYNHLVDGVVLRFQDRSFLVEEACSGIHSLFPVVSCTVFYFILLGRGMLRATAVLFGAIFWVLVVNATRVTLVAVLSVQWHLPVAEGWMHEALGLVLFAGCLGLIVSTDRLLMFFVPPQFAVKTSRGLGDGHLPLYGSYAYEYTKRRSKRTKSAESDAPPQPLGLRKREAAAVLVAFGLLLAWQPLVPSPLPPPSAADVDWTRFTETTLPDESEGWTRSRFERVERAPGDPNGQVSQRWFFNNKQLRAAISLDGPFLGWHNLAGCLEGQGWHVVTSRNRSFRSIRESLPGGFTELTARNGLDRNAYVLFAVVDDRWNPMPPPSTQVGFRVSRRFPGLGTLWQQLTTSGGGPVGRADRKSLQVQLFVETPGPLSESDRRSAKILFHSMRRRLAEAAP